ncbi:hypothetical protein PYCCODRAFT_1473314 [Trametes coccinea BRFM310]|uniref:N-acetyltransferase domain-containing protein n=1 Tax=Trametes coccinea (strain BRFM310) TaxID=1353009 RepID=A0A1Y2J5T1_TRAC3|nr:hypothetical protein PYCCODRAFT_1473314 [Trametes coccinea BRFM310]
MHSAHDIVRRAHNAESPLSIRPKYDVIVNRMRYRDIPQAVRTAGKSLANEPATQYIASAETGLLSGLRVWLVRFIRFVGYTHQRHAHTIENGIGVVVYATPEDSKHPGIVPSLCSAISKLGPREVAKRYSELGQKTAAMVQEAFGESIHDMYEIRGLIVSPKAQGRGYGKALVKTVTDVSDAAGKDMWLLTTNARSFYETIGFECVRTGTLGEGNPAWTQAPIELCIMHRRRN